MREINKITGQIVDGILFVEGFRVDLLVENRVVVELKSVEKLARVHGKQVLTYLRLLDLPVGLLINFGAASLADGLQRILNSRAGAILPLSRTEPHPPPGPDETIDSVDSVDSV